MKELSGDIKLSRVQQLWYLLYNAIRGVWGYRVFLQTTFWSPTILDGNTDSPGRQYLNAFLRDMLPQLLKHKKLSVLDIGCGTGYVREMFESLGYSGTYTGVDIAREKKFSEQSETFAITFVQKPIEDFETDERFDIVISNTSFEHIPDDAKAAQQARKYAGSEGLQIHIVPAFWALPIYLLHGYRQYTPARVAKLFPDATTVYRLGGACTFLLYFFCVTIPERLTAKMLFRKTSYYPAWLRLANRVDAWLPFMSTFYIIIVDPKYGNKK